MPIIYIPEEAALYTSSKRKLPQNEISILCSTLNKRLGIKAQDNLSKFKLDLQNLRGAVQYLRTEQEELARKPVH